MATESAAVARLLHEDVPEAPFYIPATAPAMRSRHVLKLDDTFLVLDSHGDIGVSAGPDGLFHCDTRFLSHLEFLLNGMPLLALGSNVRDDNTLLSIDLTNPDIYFENRLILPKDTLHVVRTVFLLRAAAYQRFAIRNYGEGPVELRLTMLFDSDFADLFEVRGLRRNRRGSIAREPARPATARLLYQGLDGKLRRTDVNLAPAPRELGETSAAYQIQLAPAQATTIDLSIACGEPQPPQPVAPLRAMRAVYRNRRAAARNVTTVQTSNDLFNEMLCRSMSDLYMLISNTPQGRYPYAGIPWYSTTFGRDGLISAMQMLWLDPRVALGVLRRLAAYQAKTTDASSDAEPGKILHEMRSGEMAELGEVPFGLYYGSVDATPLFVMLAGLYVERTGDQAALAELWPAIEAALSWMDQFGDLDGDGFIEYQRATEHGLANQGWKDSQDAIFHADGRLAEGPIALVEVQGYAFYAKHLAALCAKRLGMSERANGLGAEADDLARRFEESFWCPEIGMYALALDGDKQQCRVRSSNAGQVLFTGIANPEHACMVGEAMTGVKFFSGWGIRTVAAGESRYNPMSYHNGSVWPHDNALIALGLARCGLKDCLDRVFKGLFDAGNYMEMRRLPELFCGFQRGRGRGPTLYPVACSPQAWASATPFTLIEASIGLEFDPGASEIRLRNPSLPSFLEEIVLRDLQLNGASVDIKLRRHRKSVSVEVIEQRGEVQVSAVFG